MNRTTVNVHRILPLAAVGVALALATSAINSPAQSPASANPFDAAYSISYFSNANVPGAPDAQLRLSIDGTTEGNLCANIYVFNNDEEMEECCSCQVTPEGYLDLDVNKDLDGNPLTTPMPTRGVVKVVSSGGTCAPAATYKYQSGIRGWLTHVQVGATSATFSTTEEELRDSYLSASELSTLQVTCSYAQGSQRGGVCSCSDAGQ